MGKLFGLGGDQMVFDEAMSAAGLDSVVEMYGPWVVPQVLALRDPMQSVFKRSSQREDERDGMAKIEKMKHDVE